MQWVCLLALAVSAAAQVLPPRLEARPPNASNGWVNLSSSFHSNTVLTLEASTNLATWQSRGTLHDALFSYPDPSAGGLSQRFYRLRLLPRGTEDDWKNQILYPLDPLRSTNSSQDLRWIKFAILLSDPTRVYYQDSKKYPFHYDFATRRLPPFQGLDYAGFDAISLYRTHQQVVLGSVLYPPGADYPPTTLFAEYGVQFVGMDPYTPAEIGRWFELVKATVYATNGATAYYLPAFEQSEMARTNAAAFAAQGIPLASPDRWITVPACYATGWALGQLKYFPAAEISAAFGDGRLRPEDILLTDGVPADTPLVAGIISLTPSTPNSHTAILSQSFGIPFVYLANAAERERVQQLVGHKLLLRATTTYLSSLIKVVDLEGAIDSDFEAEVLALKRPEPIAFLPKQLYGAIWAPTETLVPTDIQYFGGKAANYGLLRRTVPTNCPVALAFSFDLWDAFLDQLLPGGQTLRAEITTRLAPFTNYPPDMVALKPNLSAIRDLFTKTARFTPLQQQVITNALAGFVPRRNLRFRSSTNVEDSEHFTGAGLYDSYSGCLMDDLDADTAGPCQCDPSEPKERGGFRALQKVYASFYNDDAYLERLRHGVDESQVGMGVLVHPSFPDEEELANGVATPRFTFTATATNMSGDMVTQFAAASVTNPDGQSVPEIVAAARYAYTGVPSVTLSLKQRSSLVPLGAYVLDWQTDYKGLLELFSKIGNGFRQCYPAKNGFALDFEYKKDAQMGLVIKQVREVPQPGTTNQVTPFLINEPLTLCVQQAGGGAVFATHRLKSLWTLHTANLRLSSPNLTQGIYTQGSYEYLEDDTLQRLSGPMASWPNASVVPSGATNTWVTGTGANRRLWSLNTTLTTNVTGTQPPVLTQEDLPKTLTVTYATPMPKVSGLSAPTNTLSETVALQRLPDPKALGVLQMRTLIQTNGMTIQTSYYWPKSPGGILVVYSPLLRFVETRISGLTTSPIVLTNYYAQSYGAYHHNFYEEFIFEPRLDPAVAAQTLAELRAANIQLIYAWTEAGRRTVFYALGYDQKLRKL